jgi:hypothetical protein
MYVHEFETQHSGLCSFPKKNCGNVYAVTVHIFKNKPVADTKFGVVKVCENLPCMANIGCLLFGKVYMHMRITNYQYFIAGNYN